ncbi:hypothetical protein NDU88_001300 [Pleurodeles waltl]|uniref:Uncharacterized protein n=1 Tax=Pleurodeles waltl TaxID=8319 RepID=A0AAV7P691_PLEWA|nr:hypothetical protein NDU88_001300 [Pleurodeles waltl]
MEAVMPDLSKNSYFELVPINGLPKTQELVLKWAQADPLDSLRGQDAYPVSSNVPAWDNSAGPCTGVHGKGRNMLEDYALPNVDAGRWRPDFPADRHYRSSPSPDCTRLPFTCKSRGCRGLRSPAAQTAAGALRLSGGPRKDRGRNGKHRMGPARRCERGARSRTALLFLLTERDPRRFLAVVVGVWGVWDVRMAPKLSRTPRSLRARQNQDPGGTRKDKKLPVPGLKEHSNLHVKGGLQKTTDMEKDVGNSVPTMFTSMMRIKQRSTEKAARDSQSSVPGVDDGQVPVAPISLEVLTPICDAGGEGATQPRDYQYKSRK